MALAVVHSRALTGVHAPLVTVAAHRDGHRFILPQASAAEAALVRNAEVYGATDLLGVCAHLRGEIALQPSCAEVAKVDDHNLADLADVRGQAHAKRALIVAAA